MAMYDWNGDGKNDFLDDMIEYESYRQCTSSDDEYAPKKYKSSSSGESISTSRAIVLTVLGMIGAGFICQELNIESGFLIAVIWSAISLFLYFVYSAVKK